MAEKNMHAMILTILGVIFMLIGLGIIFIHNVLRGSGVGSVFLILGVILFIIGMLRFKQKK